MHIVSIRIDHIQNKIVDNKKPSHRHAFTGELAVKLSQNEPNRAPVADPTHIDSCVSELPTSYIF